MDQPATRIAVLIRPLRITIVVRTSNSYSDSSPDDGGDHAISALGNSVEWEEIPPNPDGDDISDTILIAFGDGVSSPGLTMTGTYSFRNLRTKHPFIIKWDEVTYESSSEISRVAKTYTMSSGWDTGPGVPVTASANQSVQMEKLRFCVPWLPH